MCTIYTRPQGCPKKNYCPFAHGAHELRQANGQATGSANAGNSTPFGAPDATQCIPVDRRTSQFSSPPSNVAGKPGGDPLSPSGGFAMPLNANDFQEMTNELKIRILDLVDQVSALHFDRANVEHEIAKSQYAREVARLTASLQTSRPEQVVSEETAKLQAELQSSKQKVAQLSFLNDVYAGGESLKHLSRSAIEQLEVRLKTLSIAIKKRKVSFRAS